MFIVTFLFSKKKKKKECPQNKKESSFQYSLASRKCNTTVQRFLVSLVCKLSKLNSSWLGIYDCTLFHKDKIYGLLLIEDATAQGRSTHGNLELSAFLQFLDPHIPHKFATVLCKSADPSSLNISHEISETRALVTLIHWRVNVIFQPARQLWVARILKSV